MANEFWERRKMIRLSALSTQQKLVLFVLADYGGDNGSAFPSQQTLASDVSLSIRQIRRVLVALRKAGILTTETRGRRHSYLIHWDPIADTSPTNATAHGTDFRSACRRMCPRKPQSTIRATGTPSKSQRGAWFPLSPAVEQRSDHRLFNRRHAGAGDDPKTMPRPRRLPRLRRPVQQKTRSAKRRRTVAAREC